MTVFVDRAHAGRELAGKLLDLGDEAVVLGLPRGGVPVAAELARRLGAPLDIVVVRKVGAPRQPELALGAIAAGGLVILNHQLIADLGVAESDLDEIVTREKATVAAQEIAFRQGRAPVRLTGRTAVVVDDGLATGATMRVAVEAVRRHRPRAVVVAVPVAPRSTCRAMDEVADRVVCLQTPASFLAVSRWYVDFSPVSDAEVRDALSRFSGAQGG